MRSRTVYFEGSRVYLREQELPPLAAGEVLLRARMTLPSVGTELAVLSSQPAPEYPLGYSWVGTVAAVGSDAARFRIGERLHGCLPHADWVIVSEKTPFLYPVPEGLSDRDSSFATLAAVAMHLVERSRIALGQPVVVLGQGSVGLLTAQLARRAGAGLLVGVDPDETRRSQSLVLGADVAIPPDRAGLEAALAQAAPAAPPVFIEVSGASRAVQWILDCAPLHSRVVLAGTYLEEVRFNPFIFIERELEVIGAHQPKCPDSPVPYYPYSREMNYAYALDAMARGWLDVSGLCDGQLKPEDIPAWYAAALEGRKRLYQPVFDWRD
ncbi:MAG: zinc-binding dehydrogenase [Armatimonadetes bacterium]|nr:zinc-binding dehydrogenase [Armatimonadota bacterium]